MHGTAVIAAGEPGRTWRSRLTAYLLEIGCLFHSLIIGVSLGMSTDREEVAGLIVALCFHQASCQRLLRFLLPLRSCFGTLLYIMSGP